MKDLKQSIKTMDYYNDMEFGEFIIKFEEDTGIIVSEEEKAGWIFVGLNNTDFYKMHTGGVID